jgi:diaminopimelate epimerase
VTEFAKYEGTGNDFIVVDETFGAPTPTDARRLCDRHFGVGADGVLWVQPPRSPDARAAMVVLNPDGSRPEMCGNGLRCVALFLAERDGQATVQYRIDTDAGPRHCDVERTGDRAWVRTVLGRGVPTGAHSWESEGRRLDFSLVSTGNPHAVVFGAGTDPDVVDVVAPAVSAELGGCNVEFAEQHGPQDLELVVWERGVGRTLSCGTGAAATAIAAARRGMVSFNADVNVRLPGGPLEVRVAPDTFEVRLSGPARLVFRGRLPDGG